LKELVTERKQQFIVFNELDSLTVIPSEMLFASASGLDPHISPEAAFLQVNRITKARKFNENQTRRLLRSIKEQTEKPQFLIFGEERVNVLLLNLSLDKIN
jgi:K+-transporting ATPase ATPase C chain